MKRKMIVMGLVSALFGCTGDARVNAPTPGTSVITDDVEHNESYNRGAQLITPHMKLHGRDPNLTDAARDEVSRGIRDLDAVTAYNPQNWAAFWLKGKGYQVLGDHQAAHGEFRASFNIQKDNADVAREYASTCLELGLGGEAVRVAKHAIGLRPDDAGLYSNLALALLIDEQNIEAKNTIQKSMEMAPEDEVSQAVQQIVNDVIQGKRPQPKGMADLNGS
jgi:tetratricopeptide (TPR) repeat protein